MIHWQWGRITRILTERDGLQEVAVETGTGSAQAIVLTGLIGSVRPGEEVLLNVTALNLALGTGGFHFVAALRDRLPDPPPSSGHLMKLRYTPLQLRCQTAEEGGADLPEDLHGQVIIVGELHSQLLPAALALRRILGDSARLVYLMTDGGALPLALSRTVARMRECGLLNATVTIGHAFGGDIEALNIFSGLLAARYELGADVTLVMMGPGVAGSASRYGHTGVEQAINADAAGILGGAPIILPRISFADPRPRHQGLSHHTLTVAGRLTQRRAWLPLPVLSGTEMDLILSQTSAAGIDERHALRLVQADAVMALLADCDITARTMGRSPSEDPAFFLGAGAAGFLAGQIARNNPIPPHGS